MSSLSTKDGEPVISRYKPDSEFYTAERCHIIEIHNCSADDNCSVVRTRVRGGDAAFPSIPPSPSP